MFWQLTFDANDPALLMRFWARALEYEPVPPTAPRTTWHTHYRARLGEETAFEDRLFDPAGMGPAIWFQEVPERKAVKNRLHLDLYPTGRDNMLALERRIAIVEAKAADLVDLGHRCPPGPRRRPGGPDLLRRHARPRGQRVLRELRRRVGC